MLDEDLLDDVDVADAPWAWEAGGAAAKPAAAAAGADAAEEESILSQLAAIDFDALKDEDVEQRELASMVVDALGDDLDLVALVDAEGEVADGQQLSQVGACEARGWGKWARAGRREDWGGMVGLLEGWATFLGGKGAWQLGSEVGRAEGR